MKHLRIAVAEDNWFVAEHLCGELVARGHVVVGLARTGADLVELAQRERPELALVDIRLADGSDGLAAAQEIQERFTTPAIAATENLLSPRPKPQGS